MGILVLRILEMGKYARSRAKQWNGSKVLEDGSWKCLYVLTVCQRMADWAGGLLETSYWWDCSCARIIHSWQPALLWVRVTLEHEWHGVICCLCGAFPHGKFFFPLPCVINYDRLKSTKRNLSTPSWGSLQWSSGAGWDLPCRFLQS